MPQLNVNCFAASINFATNVKYLGVIIDNKSNYKGHIKILCKQKFPDLLVFYANST